MRALCALRRDAGERRGGRSRACPRRSTALALQRPAAAGRRAQRGRLRALGPRGEAQRPAGLAARRAAGAGAGGHRLHPVARHAGGDARRGGAQRRSGRSSRSSSAARATWRGSRRCAPARREARIVVDANEGWSAEDYAALAPALVAARRGDGRAAAARRRRRRRWPRWRGRCRSAPTRAATTAASLAALAGKYDMVNVKLDKTGGLTEALALRDAARAAGFGVMVGCMVGSSLAMAPAVLVAQGAAVDRPRRAAAARRATARIRCVYDDAGRASRRRPSSGGEMSRIVYVNGDYVPEEEARISVFDRGFLFADGVYEVTSVLDGRLVDFAGHLRAAPPLARRARDAGAGRRRRDRGDPPRAGGAERGARGHGLPAGHPRRGRPRLRLSGRAGAEPRDVHPRPAARRHRRRRATASG